MNRKKSILAAVTVLSIFIASGNYSAEQLKAVEWAPQESSQLDGIC